MINCTKLIKVVLLSHHVPHFNRINFIFLPLSVCVSTYFEPILNDFFLNSPTYKHVAIAFVHSIYIFYQHFIRVGAHFPMANRIVKLRPVCNGMLFCCRTCNLCGIDICIIFLIKVSFPLHYCFTVIITILFFVVYVCCVRFNLLHISVSIVV